MSVQYNYTHAAKRLISDAVALWAGGAREDAAHLAGLSAECALKSVLVGLGVVARGSDGQIPRSNSNQPIRAHINLLFGQFQSALHGRVGAAYASRMSMLVPQPFHDWLVDHRYVADGQLAPEALERWMWGAIMISKLLNEADGKSPREAQ